MTDKAYAVPLHELLAGVPRGARLVITDLDGMGTRFIPVGRYCHEAAEILRAKLNKPEKEVMQMALDALNNFDKGNHGMRWQVPIIKALRARLAQPEPAECDGGQCGIGGYCKQCPKTQPENEFNPDWDAMSAMVEEQQRMAKRIEELTQLVTSQGIRLMDAEAQPEQEPVAYLCENAVGHKYFRWKKPSSEYKPIALYTAPPQRIWQRLTDEETNEIAREWQETPDGLGDLCRAIEAKLKEKNNG